MSFFNWRNKGFEPARHVDALQHGSVLCGKCGRPAPLADLEPLSTTRCVKCQSMNFVPMRVADFWLSLPLGAGGMGATYRAWRENDPHPEQSYAVKILPRDEKTNPKLIGMLQNEAQVLMDIGQHPCLIHGIDAGFADDEHYLATRFVEGERLDIRIEHTRGMPELEVLCLGLRILSAETHIYNRGYLFRDLKPQNIIIDADHGAFLLDFGLCEPIELVALPDDSETVEGSAIYIPPERLTCIGERASAEIYSLGMVMYEALKGESYFNAVELDSLVRQHAREFRLANNDDKMKGINWDTAAVINKMIQRVETDRYATFSEVEFELSGILQKRLFPTPT